jgi:uncharacterized repeat protein (TIGR03803 family)
VVKNLKTMLKLPMLAMFGLLTANISHGAPEFTGLVSFDWTNGDSPHCALIQGNDDQFYGTTFLGGSNYWGTIFKMTADGNLTTLISFDWTNGAEPWGGLTAGKDGNFYGTTQTGGMGGYGSAFQISPQGQFTNLVYFNGTNGNEPNKLIQGNDDNFYGTTLSGGTNQYYGTVFKLDTNGSLAVLYSFNGDDGSEPMDGLVQDDDSNLYGTTMDGGTNFIEDDGAGTVFKMALDGTLIWSVSFNGTNGDYPMGELVQGMDGNFYGTTYYGGTNYAADDSGTIFKITPNGALASIYSFSSLDYLDDNSDGANPDTALIQGDDGCLYGTTSAGGKNGAGTIFKITTNGVLTTLYSFGAITNSYGNPLDGDGSKQLVKGSDGNLYGTAYQGGEYDNVANGGLGTIFKLSFIGPIINVSLLSNTVVLTWNNPAFSLQAAPTASGIYTNVPGAASPYTNAITGSQMFFRLKSN